MMKFRALGLTDAPFAHVQALPLGVSQTRFRVSVLICLLLIGLSLSHAADATTGSQARYQRVTAITPTNQDIYLTVSQYEIALVQVLSEICPPVLNERQRLRFDKAYNRQLREFMPRATNPQQSLRLLSGRRDYRAVLHNVRSWTASYPASENRALCREFAEMSV
ncbi:hypothetical protein NGM44_02330 [Moraxella sp. FZFQ2102]|uniref:MCR_0457 family protein n=1 Tax=Moraxella sp. FZFQ2102 TaxID=2953752 RepID=UPI00209BC5EB|nr:hypothetical protein [Moraxella sp. FZFQ2102]USZ15253.1 hypothetical protein NGM44_02330 [Moraxella sp. FZFQ2102]